MKSIRKCLINLSLCFLLAITIPMPVMFSNGRENVNMNQEKFQMRGPVFVWAFKNIDGALYKRLYNESTGEWASDWIRV